MNKFEFLNLKIDFKTSRCSVFRCRL